MHSHSNWWLQPSWILLSWIQPFCTKKNSLVLSDSTWWWQPSWILPCWIQTLPSWIQTTLLFSLRFTQKHSHSTLTLTQTNSIWFKLNDSQLIFMMASIFNSGHLGFSHFSLSSQTHWHLPRLVPTIFTQKTSLIHSDSTWWFQPSWNLPCWIQTLLSWIQTPCYLLSDSLKNTLPQLWPWLKLIQSD